jgi:hypothetical protein
VLKEVFFQDGGCRTEELKEVRFTGIEHVECDNRGETRI